MLSARAYSLRQKSRLAISLSWIGGYTNIVALLGFGTVVSHVTGTTTQFWRHLGAHETDQTIFLGSLLLMFLVGASLSAVMTESARRHGWRSKYVLPLALEATLLGLVSLYPAGKAVSLWGTGHGVVSVASLAMGLQNATITKISGAIVRTTHLTGIFTDLGLEGIQYLFWCKDRMARRRWARTGRLLRISTRHPSAERVLLLASIAGSFGLGCWLGYLAFTSLSLHALVAPAVFLLWIIYVDLHKPIADVREIDLLKDPELKLHDLVSQLLPPEVVLYRFACARGNLSHRAPNFQLWLNRVPDACRIVVLAISPLTRFDENAVLDLEAATRTLHARGRKLIISGVVPAQFRALAALGVDRLMDINNLCPDLEFAIARALALLPPREAPALPGETHQVAGAALTIT